MSEKIELLPCPFCGCVAEEDATGCAEYYGHEHQDYSITCKGCGALVEVTTGSNRDGIAHKGDDFPCSCCHDTREAAIAKWNTRAILSPPAADCGLEVVAWQLGCQTMGGVVGYILSWSQSGAGVCNRLQGEEYEVPLVRKSDADALQSELNEARTSIAHLLIELDAVKVPDGDGQRAALDHSAQSLGMVGSLVTALDGLLSITQDSAGVAGYHLNGNVAEWDEFPEVSTARDVLNLYRELADKPCFFGIDLAQGAIDAGPLRDAIIDQGWTPPGQQQASEKVPCSAHPDAPHGFNRTASHCANRYVCDCEGWVPTDEGEA